MALLVAEHYVVIYAWHADTVLIGDPAHGTVAWDRPRFLERWSGHLLLLEVSPPLEGTAGMGSSGGGGSGSGSGSGAPGGSGAGAGGGSGSSGTESSGTSSGADPRSEGDRPKYDPSIILVLDPNARQYDPFANYYPLPTSGDTSNYDPFHYGSDPGPGGDVNRPPRGGNQPLFDGSGPVTPGLTNWYNDPNNPNFQPPTLPDAPPGSNLDDELARQREQLGDPPGTGLPLPPTTYRIPPPAQYDPRGVIPRPPLQGGITQVQRTNNLTPHSSPQVLAADPRIRAMLDVIAFTEGTGNNYGKIVNGTVIKSPNFPDLVGKKNVSVTDLSRHPHIRVRVNSSINSTAAGRYQFLDTSWDELGMTDFTPHSQDIAAVRKMQLRGMIKPLLNGNVIAAVHKGAPEWASLPKASGGSNYSGQSAHSLSAILARYQAALDQHGR